MNYFRLSNDQSSKSEFFTDDIPAKYLKNIKDLNIIIGANNTRKSRFIRQIISTEHKVLIRSGNDFNRVQQTMKTLFEGIEETMIDVKLVSLIFNQPQNVSFPYDHIKGYFSKQIAEGNHLTFFDIRNTLNNISETISLLATQEQIKNLNIIVTRVHETLQLTLNIYKGLQENLNVDWGSSYPTDVPGIMYKIIEGFTGQNIDQIGEKIKILESVIGYTNIIKDLKIEPLHENMMVYIPVLRTSRRLIGASSDLYKKTIQQQYKLADNAKLTIETGLDLYEKIEMARNGHRNEREQFAAFEKFISDIFFNSRSIDIIAVKSNSETERHVKLSLDGEQDDIAIHNLGDGIQGIINLLLPVFTARDKSWIFIDEPENHLHPGYQNIFMNAICANQTIKNKKLKFFINTHSNHILSEALMGNADTEILVFSRRDKDSSNILAFDGNEYHTLEMLGVFNTSVLISNCTIWVEGITDRLYLRAFLFAYYNSGTLLKAMPIEGLNYSFVEYAGNNLIHYSFDHKMSSDLGDGEHKIKAFFINSNVFLLADADFENEEKHQFYKDLEKRKNFEYFQTELPEIENILPDSVLRSWLLEDLRCDSKEIDNCFEVPISNEKLGAYFHGKFNYRKKPRKFMNPAEGGTLRSDLKKRLADYVHAGIINKSITWDELRKSNMLKKLVTQLDMFIQQRNQKSIYDN